MNSHPASEGALRSAEARIALLIDADNSPAAKIDVVLAELAKFGVANIRRAYGNWKNPGLVSWEKVLHEYAIRPMQQFDYTKGKNATDASMIIDAMDLLYGHKLDAFAIVSSDSDFTPLVMRILTDGLKVYGFGEMKTPAPFRNACTNFLYLEKLGQQEEAVATKSPGSRKSEVELKQHTKLVALLRNAVSAASGEDGWSSLGAVRQQVTNQASFDQRNYGYAKFSDFMEATGLFDSERRDKLVMVRDKRDAKRTKRTSTPIEQA